MIEHSTDATQQIIHTSGGDIRGTTSKGVRTWRGIPFAEPPVGELRLRAPRPHPGWDGVLDASAFGFSPPQLERKGMNETARDEDCLTINVSAPMEPSDEPLPVLVYFYGGAFSLGTSSTPAYSGETVVRRGNVVYVCMNYRLGALGFLDFSRFNDDEHTFDSNVGLRDQVLGLEWVRDNIAAFGGDPDNVTIFGESAGAMSVISLMAIPAAEGLFHKAFAMSPAPSSVYSAERHRGWAKDFIDILGVDEEHAAEALATRPWRELRDAMSKLTDEVGPQKNPSSLSASPVVEGDFIPKHTIDAFRDGDVHRVPFVVGTMSREGALFPILMDVMPTKPERIEKMFEQTEPEAMERVIAAYPGYPSKKRAIDLGGDVIFWHPTVQITEAHSRYAPTWAYRFDYETPILKITGIGATHGMDVPSIFGDYDGSLGRMATLLGGRKKAMVVSERFQDMLFAFARTGEPGAGWPQYDEEQRQTKIIDRVDRIDSDPRGERRRAWGDYRGFL